MQGIERIKKPAWLLKKTLTDVMFEEFTRLGTDEALKIDVNALGATLSGVRYAIRAWNRKHEPKLKVKVKQSRTAPIVYVYYEP